jgi:NAD(P)-dependent dehydrogenase (short-subunit alcohol dehydrogenase family)
VSGDVVPGSGPVPPPPPPLEGRVAWLTGASGGLGVALAHGLAAAGATVVLTSRSAPALEQLAGELEACGHRALALPISVSDPGAVGSAVVSIVERFGRLDALVHAAGISPSFSRSESLGDEEWRTILDVNLSGAFYCSREAGRVMLERDGGAIVHVSSVHARSAGPRLAAYAASKGGLEALTRTLAVEWAGRNVRVNAVAPGYFAAGVAEPLLASRWRDQVLAGVPMRRFGEPPELVGAVVFLASDASAYVTGTTITVDGGWMAQ